MTVTETRKIDFKVYDSKMRLLNQLICEPIKSGSRLRLYVKGKLVADKRSNMDLEELDRYLKETVYCREITYKDVEYSKRHECERIVALVHGHRYRSLA